MPLCLDSPADLSDDTLVGRYRLGDVEALDTLLERYRRFVRSKARGYFLVGADFDDIEQEGMIGLYKAVRDFRDDRQASFRAFAELCITRQIITAIKTATRQKHQPLNQYVSISGVRGGDDPSERMGDMRDSMASLLSGLEVDVLRLYVEGRSYQEIGEELGRHVKSIDNALQRIKRKLELHLAERDATDSAEDALLVG